MTVDTKAYFSQELLAWYRAHKRDLPWRHSRDPYRIWVSEIMLQQTRVDTVIPYYKRFLDKFPTLQALAEAPEEEVLKCWEGLGYYSRARNLQAGAREVVRLHGGSVPDDVHAVAALKGVGPYTRGAIMSIAFNRPEPAVDGNVMRVLSRYMCLEEDIAKSSTRVRMEILAKSLIPEGAAGDFNQGLMELGALICTPKSPGCLICPVMAHCAARLAGREKELPIKSKAKPPRPELRLAALIEGSGEQAGRILVRQRPDSGLLARMWELPHILAEGAEQEGKTRKRGRPAAGAATAVAAAAAWKAGAGWAWGMDAEQANALEAGPEGVDGESILKVPLPEQMEQMELLSRQLAAETSVLVRPRHWWMEADHVFSHIVWKVQVYLTDYGFVLNKTEQAQSEGDSLFAAESAAGYEANEVAGQREELPPGYRWIGPAEMEELAFPNVFVRILREYWQQRGSNPNSI
ncbi:A/G-specific adenine glycosylase [Paenibacillus daejeonensis]|uniref:A/G-specific adenine glycosylase n=1 Tax=Paenibacillus daejeonensis TaxID=135193 RepID=UPI000370BCA5|nr:A/G-specific adenine glycosylase [Paenibacillus daejeonensis]